ncbi:transaldolase [Aquipuribacter nitratireducens]|uniref:Transaldolase n=1 Tax=Aquipuribacter nitratireducens TaxID=650104 RepID=A0ABW0GKG1_9MICO
MSTAPTVSEPVAALSRHGVSVWLDDLSRDLVRSGDLERLVARGVVGVTSNPTIFASALAKGTAYEDQVRELVASGATVEEAVTAVTTTDVREACDVLAPVYEATGGQDGRVSLEVDPRLAHDTARTIEQAKALAATVDRPNVMIKIPATVEGLPAITAVLAEGISVNVTLIFSLDRYRAVLNAWLDGLERAQEAGTDVTGIRSVASFFVSRVDSAVDARLDEVGGDAAASLRGTAAVANARLAYQAYEEVLASTRWADLEAAGAHPQRPLWASTGVKDPAYPDTKYVVDLVAPDTVNTMPGSTLAATEDHAEIAGDTVRDTYTQAAEQLDAVERLGIGYVDVVTQLEKEGVAKFEASWEELLGTVEQAMAEVRESGGQAEHR